MKPRLGFLGVGWIGRNRLEAVLAAGLADVVAVADPSRPAAEAAAALAPGAQVVPGLDALLALGLDGIVIATPSAFHASQAKAALDAGAAVFCQKPLGRNAAEAADVVEAARKADRLLSVDLCYRHTAAMRAVKNIVATGQIGPVHAIDLTFHNAYGPDKPWFYDAAMSGGGCVMDLGVHLIDLALWLLERPKLERVSSSHLFWEGRPLADRSQVEDFAVATLELGSGTIVRLACSWRLPAGRDAVIGVEVYGNRGGVAMRNVDGSFYDFVAERFHGTSTNRISTPPDDWGGRAIVHWATRLARGEGHDAEQGCDLVALSRIVDAIYGRQP